jgi:hypothetical protein
MDIIIDGNQSYYLNGLWNTGIYSISMRTFLFKFHNNTLGYNTSVAHFVRNHSPLCTFCNLENNHDGVNETPAHLFFECRPVENLITEFFRTITRNNQFEISRRELFTTFERNDLSFAKNKILCHLPKLLICYIWTCRNRFSLPNLANFLDFLSPEISTIKQNNKNFNTLWVSSEYTLG